MNAKPKRRKTARPEEIIKAALVEFAELGFAAAKLENIAKRAGVVKGTIYRYFPSKEALFDAALQPQVGPIFEQINEIIDSYPGPSADLLDMIISQIYAKAFSDDLFSLIQIVITEGKHFPEIARLYHEQVASKGLMLLQKILTRGVARGEFRDAPAVQMPVAVIGPLIATLVWKMTFDTIEPLNPDTMAKAHVDLILDGLHVRITK